MRWTLSIASVLLLATIASIQSQLTLDLDESKCSESFSEVVEHIYHRQSYIKDLLEYIRNKTTGEIMLTCHHLSPPKMLQKNPEYFTRIQQPYMSVTHVASVVYVITSWVKSDWVATILQHILSDDSNILIKCAKISSEMSLH